MKREFLEQNDQHKNMFAQLHQTQKSHHPSSSPPPPMHQHFQVAREYQASEEADSRSPGPSVATGKKEPGSQDGASVEVGRRPRGRPPGSKNKPKPPVVITRDTDPNSMSPYVLEIAGGADIIDSVTRFCRKRNVGLCILAGSGAVMNIAIRQPSTPGATVAFHGRFDLLSISATVLPPTMTSSPLMQSAAANGFTVSLAGPQGQMVGGSVVGPLLATGTVYLVAASFNNPLYQRLPLEETPGNEGAQLSSPGEASGSGDGGHPPAAAEPGGMSMYGCHLGSDVIWAPTARQPPPPY